MNVPTLLAKGFRYFLRRFRNEVIFRIYPILRLPYPISVEQRDGKDTTWQCPEIFDRPEAIEINHARMSHLAALGLPLEGKRVLDVGCGVGHLAQFFVNHSCEVVCIDAREENIISLQSRYPGLNAHVADVEVEPLSKFGTFDIVFCYGLLYHLENPLAALRNMASVCKELLLLETIITDCALPILRMEDESAAFDQAVKGLGCRPSPSYVVMGLNRIGFKLVYAPKRPPEHRDFQFRRKNNLDVKREGHRLRCVFIASRTNLQNKNLVRLIT